MKRLIALFILFLLSPAYAQQRAVPDSSQQIQLSFAPLVKQATPAVVNIYAKQIVTQRGNPLLNDPFFRQLFGDTNMPAPAQKREQNSLGSGVIVSDNGLIVTSAHVIQNAKDIKVILSDRREFDGAVTLKDDRTDLAVIKIDTEGEKLPFIKLADSDQVQVGDMVLAIGNPFGVGQTVTSGIVSASARTGIGATDYNYFIQTDAAINPGNSGGALIDMNGQLIGINASIFSQSGGSLGIGFAVPSNMVKTVLAAVGHNNKLIRPWLGVSGQEVTVDLARELKLSRPAGVLISQVKEKSPAADAGLKAGDVVMAIASQPVDNPSAMRFRIGTQTIGSDVPIKIWRDGKEENLIFKALAAPEIPPRNETLLTGEQPLAGATLANLSPALADELNLSNGDEGVVITAIKPNSYAAQFVQPRDKLVAVNEKMIKNVGDAVGALKKRPAAWRLTIQRGKQQFNIVLN